MTKSMKTLVLTAAISGLLGGASATTTQFNPDISPEERGLCQREAGKVAFAKSDKHSCKGKNNCKGQGGCKTGDNGCKGKNSCKGKGGCNTEQLEA